MRLSEHAKVKLEIYGISGNEVIKMCTNPVYEFYDNAENTFIKIVEFEKRLFVVVIAENESLVITVYTTDGRTILNRQKNLRWK